ncbi:MAG: M43 family zinc metalloprotease, partial [Saprospiraceae bacterium]
KKNKTIGNDWCFYNCDPVLDKHPIQDSIHNIHQTIKLTNKFVVFPLRIATVIDTLKPKFVAIAEIQKMIEQMNEGFKDAHIAFEIIEYDTIFSNIKIDNLADNTYQTYINFSKENDIYNYITIYLFDYDNKFCDQKNTSVTCYRKSGFSFVLSDITSNIVLSKFDFSDAKVATHEMGHFFGLEHTFEVIKYGVERADGSNCRNAGDRICDTPADPGIAYSVYVHYSDCEMKDLVEKNTEIEFKPLIANYMSYYNNCYMKKYSFTNEQNKVIFAAAMSKLRYGFSKNSKELR